MATRLKVFLIITLIVLAITVSSMLISISSAQGQILTTLETNMEMLASASNEYVMKEMDLLKADAAAVAYALSLGYQDYELPAIIQDQAFAYSEKFETIAVFELIESSCRMVSGYSNTGVSPPPEDVVREYRNIVLNDGDGERVITTTYNDPSGELVFYVFVPIDDGNKFRPRILGITVSGSFFSERMKQLTKMNPSGRISILDKEGTIIADINDTWVEERLSFLERIAAGVNSNTSVEIQEILSTNKTGAGRYTLIELDGKAVGNVTAFMAIQSTEKIQSPEKWVIAVSTPIIKDRRYVGYSYFAIRGMILLSGIIFMVMGVLAATLASGIIAKPFELLKAATKAKTAFIANMSHDLRTPLNAIVSFSQLSRTIQKLPPEIGDHQKKIFESGMHILGVINDLLDISNIESGKFGVISAEYDLPNFILDTANSNMRHIGSRPIVFNIIPRDDLPARLIGDSLRIRQIFNNLLRNAIANTKAGTVEWKIFTERDENTIWVVSSISDSGPGVNPEDVDKLFLDYSSLDTQKMRSSHGTGLGLALTKKIVDLMKGTISVESVSGKGTVFTVRLPHKFVNDEPMSAELAEKLKAFKTSVRKRADIADMQRVQLSGARALVVDDVELNLDVTRGMIEPYGIQVDGVSSGQEAVDIIRKGEPRYDMVFMNRWMPEMDGIEAVRIIREIGNEYVKNLPVIALVANAITGNNAFFINSGFRAVLSKPINVFKLDEIINQLAVKK